MNNEYSILDNNRIQCNSILRRFPNSLKLLLVCCIIWGNIQADVVRPALVEISTQANGKVIVEIRASLEALLTGINARYRNTQEAPQAAAYDALRLLPAPALQQRFVAFQAAFLAAIQLRIDQQLIDLSLDALQIPEPGYTQVPRISQLTLSGDLPTPRYALQWYYPARFGDNAVRVRQVDTQANHWHWSDWQWIRHDQPSRPFALQQSNPSTSLLHYVIEYVGIGFTHILPLGADHILFILGLYLFGNRWRPLCWQVSVFTLAHSLTLGLGLAGFIRLPAAIVEPLIAASIVYVAIENIGWHTLLRPVVGKIPDQVQHALPTTWYTPPTNHTLALPRHRLGVVFGFGLLHGLGFAAMLQTFQMPPEAFYSALLGFNLGVELGQLAVLVIAFALTGWLRNHQYYRRWVVVPGSVGIALIGLFWMVERLPVL